MRNILKIGLVLFVVMGLTPLASAHACTKWSIGIDVGHQVASTCVEDDDIGEWCVGRPHVCGPDVFLPYGDRLEGLLA